MKTPYSFTDYRDYLRQEVLGREERGLLSRLAEAANCQRSHISRVLSAQLHLTPEQAFRIARFLKFNEGQAEYFLTLVEFCRSGDKDHRAYLQVALKRMKAAHEDLAKRIKDQPIGAQERELTYYSSWHWSAIHIIVSIQEFHTVSAIARRLSLAPELVESCLLQLQEFNLVRHEKGRWSIASGSLHLAKRSPFNSIQHSNWRGRAVLASQSPSSDGVHYTVVQSISRTDFERIKQLLLVAIDDYTKIAKPSREEELVCFLCDFFRV